MRLPWLLVVCGEVWVAGAKPDASHMDTLYFVHAGPADQMKAMTLQDLLGDDTKGSAKAHDWWTHMVLPDISPIELHQT
eukprot:g24210.t1